MTRFSIGLAVVLFTVAGVAGCVDATAPPAVGHVDIALTAQGAGGVIYRLPPGSSLALFNESFNGGFPLDGDAPSQTLQVPPGDYAVALFDFAGDTTTWPLTRQQLDGTTDIVSGTLQLARTIRVVENQTTPLVIRFDVEGIGPVTFRHGSVEVSVEVDQSSAIDVAWSATALRVVGLARSEDAPDVLKELPSLGDTGDGYAVTAHTVGPWSVRAPRVVCAPAAAGTVQATGNQRFAELVAEAPPSGQDQLCIVQFEPQLALVEIDFARQGPATTPLLSGLGDQFFVTHSIHAEVDAAIFDGTTLHLEALLGMRPSQTNVSGQISVQEAGSGFETPYVVSEVGDGTISVAPH